MGNDSWVSSEQALDDYFSALLDEDTLTVGKDLVEALPTTSEDEPQPQRQAVAEQAIDEEATSVVAHDEPEMPNLDDVEKLLRQLESENPVESLELEEVLEQNTDQIKLEKSAQLAESEVSEVSEVSVDKDDIPN